MFLLEEDKANQFARDFLFPKENSNYIKPLIHNELAVKKYASENEIHPSFIYSFYQYDQHQQGRDYWGAFKDHFPDIKRTIRMINIVPWEYDSIEESADHLKQTINQIISS